MPAFRPLLLMAALMLVGVVGCAQRKPAADPFAGSRQVENRQIPRHRPDRDADTSNEPASDPDVDAPQRDVDLNTLARTFQTEDAVGEANARDALYRSGQAVSHSQESLFPAEVRPPGEAGVEQAANLLIQSQLAGASLEEADVRRRLQKLELELQITEDHAAQETLALEIATLRKQLRRFR